MKYYIDFVARTTEQYHDCTLEQRLGVYVQHYPAVVVPFLQELIERVNDLECERNDDRNTIIELRETYND